MAVGHCVLFMEGSGSMWMVFLVVVHGRVLL